MPTPSLPITNQMAVETTISNQQVLRLMREQVLAPQQPIWMAIQDPKEKVMILGHMSMVPHLLPLRRHPPRLPLRQRRNREEKALHCEQIGRASCRERV